MSKNDLKQILEVEGITERELSEKSGISVGTINRLANQKRAGSPKTQVRIVKGLNECKVAKVYNKDDVFPSNSRKKSTGKK